MVKGDELISIIKIKEKEVRVGVDDYGQCYFASYIDENGEEQEVSFGTYCTEFMEDLFFFADEEFRNLFIKKTKGELNEKDKARLDLYYSQFDGLYGSGVKEVKL